MKRAYRTFLMLIGTFFLWWPIICAQGSDSDRVFIPVLLNAEALAALGVVPGDNAICDVTYFFSPRGEPVLCEPDIKIHWLTQEPVLLLGSTKQSLPKILESRATAFIEIVVQGQKLSEERIMITPRRSHRVLPKDWTNKFERTGKVFNSASGSYSGQVASFLANQLTELNVTGTTYSTQAAGNVISNGQLTLNTLSTTGKVTGQGGRTVTVPAGTILMWSGTLQQEGEHWHPVVDGTPDMDWYLCDGSQVGSVTLPDLRDRFLMGSDDAGIGMIGGAEERTLSLSNIGHRHPIDVALSEVEGHIHQIPDYVNEVWEFSPLPGDTVPRNASVGELPMKTQSAGLHSHHITGNTHPAGASSPESFSTLPPFYVVAFIMAIPQ